MSSNIYRQGDTRWAGIKYPSKPYTIGRSGCGLMALLHCLMENPKYCNYTPKDIVGYMRQYATRGNGTLWKGELNGLKHYGYSAKQLSANTMSPVWEELNKGHRIGIIRMLAPNRHSVKYTWTTGGHYIMFSGYKVVGKKHYFKIKDSGGRHRDGWHCYETQMRGMFGPIFIAKRIRHDLKGKYLGDLPSGKIKKGSKGENVKNLQRFLNAVFKINIAVDGKFGNITDSWLCQFQVETGIEEDGICGPVTIGKMQKYALKKA